MSHLISTPYPKIKIIGLLNYLSSHIKDSKKNPLPVLRKIISEVTLNITIKARSVGRTTHQVPIKVRST